MGFAIFSAVFGGIITIVCICGIDAYKKMYFSIEKQMALMALIMMLGIVEVFVGIVAALCIFLIKPCTCCSNSPQQQVCIAKEIKCLDRETDRQADRQTDRQADKHRQTDRQAGRLTDRPTDRFLAT